MSLEIKYSSAPLGHEVRGVDLAAEISDAVFAEIERAFDTHGVVIFRDQQLTPTQQLAFSRRFGPLDRHPLDRFNLPSAPEIFVVSNVIENGEPIGMADAGRYWHSDMWVVESPPRGSILYAIEVPVKDGVALGDTYFSSTAAAYDALPEDIKETLEGRKAVFSTAQYNDYRAKQSGPKGANDDDKGAKVAREERQSLGTGEILHSVVRIHPRTGRKCLYVSEHAITRIVGLDDAESARMIAFLEKHVVRPEFVYRHTWRVGDVVMWDNCSAIHRATGDYALPLRRLMHRTTLKGNQAA